MDITEILSSLSECRWKDAKTQIEQLPYNQDQHQEQKQTSSSNSILLLSKIQQKQIYDKICNMFTQFKDICDPFKQNQSQVMSDADETTMDDDIDIDVDKDNDGGGEYIETEILEDDDDDWGEEEEPEQYEKNNTSEESQLPASHHDHALWLISIVKSLCNHGIYPHGLPLYDLIQCVSGDNNVLGDTLVLLKAVMSSLEKNNMISTFSPAIIILLQEAIRIQDINIVQYLVLQGYYKDDEWNGGFVASYFTVLLHGSNSMAVTEDQLRINEKRDKILYLLLAQKDNKSNNNNSNNNNLARLYRTGFDIFELMNVINRGSEIKLLLRYKMFLDFISCFHYSNNCTLLSVAHHQEEFDFLVDSVYTSRRTSFSWLSPISISDQDAEPGIILHKASSDTILKRMLEEMENVKTSQIFSSINLPSYIASNIIEYYIQNQKSPEMIARLVLYVQDHVVKSSSSSSSSTSSSSTQKLVVSSEPDSLSIKKMNNISHRLFKPIHTNAIRKLRHFIANANPCVICMEDTLDRLTCDHSIHVDSCMLKLENSLCPCCRVEIKSGASVQSHHVESLKNHILQVKEKNYQKWMSAMNEMQELYGEEPIPSDILHSLAQEFNS